MTEDNKGNPSDAASSHFEYAPIVKHTENVVINIKPRFHIKRNRTEAGMKLWDSKDMNHCFEQRW